MASNVRLFGIGAVIAGTQAPASATELLELDIELTSELLRLDDELDLLLELDATITVELAELAAELCRELDKLDSKLDLRLLELLRLDDTLLTLELIPLDEEPILACELESLDTTTITDELLWELSPDEFEKLLKAPSEEDERPTLDDPDESDKEDTATLDDTGEDKDDELNTVTDERVAAAELLENVAPPPPPPQDAIKATDNSNVLTFNCVNDGIGIND